MNSLLRQLCYLVGLCLLTACVSPPEVTPAMPLLRLPPAALGQPLTAQQQLTVKTRERELRLDVLLEVDANSVRLALLDLGQVMARLQWDGERLETSTVPGWPTAVGGERVLSDLQLMYWPTAAIRQALPDGWTLQEADERTRSLWHQGQRIAVATQESPTRARLLHERDGYALTIDSVFSQDAAR